MKAENEAGPDALNPQKNKSLTGGGSALWFADQCRALRLPTRVVTLDIDDMRAPEVSWQVPGFASFRA